MLVYYALSTLYVFTCLLLLLVVLLQQGRGGDIASAFGGGGSQTAFGARAGATLLTKATTILGALFMILSLGLAVIGQRGPASVVRGFRETTPAKPATPSAPASVPGKTPQPQPTAPQSGLPPAPSQPVPQAPAPAK